MALITKYEKVNSNNLKRWMENVFLNKHFLNTINYTKKRRGRLCHLYQLLN